MIGPLLFGLLVAVAVFIGFLGLWRTTRNLDPLEARLKEFGVGRHDVMMAADGEETTARRRLAWPTVSRLLAGFGLGPRIATLLMRADVPLTAAEFALIMFGVGLVGFVIGFVRLGPAFGLLFGVPLSFIPLFYVRYLGGRRRRLFTEQLPDILTLLVGSLRAGYGLSQSLEMLVDQLPDPAAKEFARVMRAVEFGMPITQALNEMASRVDSDDLDLVVTAINVQHEVGGNLAQTLEIIGETVRERIRILRQIRVLTAQQRITGYVLAVWPVIVGFAFFLINPDYIMRLFEPGLRWLPAAAAVAMIAGFLMIRRIVDIEV
jgi:tight adherence protein B